MKPFDAIIFFVVFTICCLSTFLQCDLKSVSHESSLHPLRVRHEFCYSIGLNKDLHCMDMKTSHVKRNK